MAIKWTPWFNVPMHRRLEVLSVACYMFLALLLGPISAITLILLLIFGNIYSRIICGLYVAFLCYDWRTGDRGGRDAGVAWVKNLSIWKHCMNYFPIDLVKTAELPPDRNYLVCIFPHGALCVGVGGNFTTGYSKWPKLFPGVRTRLTTLTVNVMMPLQREVLLSCGMCSASANSLRSLLNQSNDTNYKRYRDECTSTAVGLVLGGLRETSYTCPDTYRCVLEKRRGFIRIALETGASLVPAISFGENNIYKKVDIKSKFVQRMIKRMGFQRVNEVPFLSNGRGFFQYNFGLLPIRQPVTTVIGAPIHLENNSNPTPELIDKIHKIFCTHLDELFETHKNKYVGNYENIHLEIV